MKRKAAILISLAALCLAAALGANIYFDSAKYKFTGLFYCSGMQDGAIYDGVLFSMDNDGVCYTYNIKNGKAIGEFKLEKNELIKVHANSVCFGTEFYDDGDRFPLLYVNVYNAYADQPDRKMGVCCVYRMIENGKAMSCALVQILKISFTDDDTLWHAGEDSYAFGNFVVDVDNNDLYVFAMLRDTVTRFFKFDMPSYSDGAYDELYGVNVCELSASDITDMFDCEFFDFIQGCTYHGGRILSLEGLIDGGDETRRLRIVDLKEKKVVKDIELSVYGLSGEPELISVYGGYVYYKSINYSRLYRMHMDLL